LQKVFAKGKMPGRSVLNAKEDLNNQKYKASLRDRRRATGAKPPSHPTTEHAPTPHRGLLFFQPTNHTFNASPQGVRPERAIFFFHNFL